MEKVIEVPASVKQTLVQALDLDLTGQYSTKEILNQSKY